MKIAALSAKFTVEVELKAPFNLRYGAQAFSFSSARRRL